MSMIKTILIVLVVAYCIVFLIGLVPTFVGWDISKLNILTDFKMWRIATVVGLIFGVFIGFIKKMEEKYRPNDGSAY